MKHLFTRPDKRICDTCSHSAIAKGPSQQTELVYCNIFGRYMPFPVVECSGYSEKGSLDEYQAFRMGWVLEVKGGRVIGFKPPQRRPSYPPCPDE